MAINEDIIMNNIMDKPVYFTYDNKSGGKGRL